MIAELKAIKLLTKQGYWCARSLDPQSPFDIVVVDKKGKVRLIDVVLWLCNTTISCMYNYGKSQQKRQRNNL